MTVPNHSSTLVLVYWPNMWEQTAKVPRTNPRPKCKIDKNDKKQKQTVILRLGSLRMQPLHIRQLWSSPPVPDTKRLYPQAKGCAFGPSKKFTHQDCLTHRDTSRQWRCQARARVLKSRINLDKMCYCYLCSNKNLRTRLTRISRFYLQRWCCFWREITPLEDTTGQWRRLARNHKILNTGTRRAPLGEN